MNALNISFENYIPNIIEAFVQVYGEEFRDIIVKRVNSIQYVCYNNVEGISAYHDFLLTCKSRELLLAFFSQIGINIDKVQHISFAEPLNDDIERLIQNYFGSLSLAFQKYPTGIKAFGTIDESISKERILSEQLKFLNYYRGQNQEMLTLENLDQFKRTEEYSQIKNLIDNCLNIYSNLLSEFEQYKKSIKDYDNYSKNEEQRLLDILKIKRNEFYNSIELHLPSAIRDILNNNGTDDNSKITMLFNDDTIANKFCIEYFSQEDEDKINNPTLEESEKKLIYYNRINFFKSLGINVNQWTALKNYNEFIQREDIKSLIPPVELVKQFTKSREKKHEEALRQFIFSSQTFTDNTKRFPDNSGSREAIYSRMKKNIISIVGASDNDNNFIPILFYTVNSGNSGKLDYVFLHEMTHAIESEIIQGMGYRSGFDCVVRDVSLNPYNNQKRLYERINEVFTDVFAIETRNILHEQGIYFAETPEYTITNVNDDNTCSILKIMVKPLLDRFRSQIIEARLFGRTKELYDVIGAENYESLNDSINKVDFLLDNGLWGKLKENQNEDPLVIEYNYQLARVEQIYTNIYGYEDVSEHLPKH